MEDFGLMRFILHCSRMGPFRSADETKIGLAFDYEALDIDVRTSGGQRAAGTSPPLLHRLINSISYRSGINQRRLP
jgi:hypothetical protein